MPPSPLRGVEHITKDRALTDHQVAPGAASAGLSPRVAGLGLALVCLALGATSSFEARLVSTVHGNPIPWAMVVMTTTPRWLLLAAALPMVLTLAWRYPVAPLTPRVVTLHVAVFLVLSGVHAVVHAWSLGLGSPFVSLAFTWTARITRSWLNTMPTLVFIYVAIVVSAWGMAEARERQRRTLRASQLEAQLQAARLTALRAQIQPHFLYNTLNGIAALVADLQPSRAVAAIEQLGELLHASLREDGREVIPIAEEVALAGQYLALQQLRFGQRLRYTVDVAPAIADCGVPVLLLQPLVENAVIHGLDAGRETLEVVITAAEHLGGIELRVENDGPDLAVEPDRSEGHGVGLASTRARLETAFGSRAALTLLPRAGGGVIVRIQVPRLAAPRVPTPTLASEAVG